MYKDQGKLRIGFNF